MPLCWQIRSDDSVRDFEHLRTQRPKLHDLSDEVSNSATLVVVLNRAPGYVGNIRFLIVTDDHRTFRMGHLRSLEHRLVEALSNRADPEHRVISYARCF